MNPEVIKLFGEKNSKSEGSPALTHEIDSLWKMSETLVEARQKLELPLRQMLSRSAQAEKELVETRTTVAQSRENYERSTEQVRVLKAQLEKQHHENLTLTHKNSTLEQRSQHLERDREKLMTCLNSERKRAMDSAAQLRTLTTTLENKEQEFKQVSQALQQYQSHWSRLVENDRKLREIIRQQQSMMRTRIEEQKILAAAERSGLESRIEQLAREKEILEKQVAMSAKELQTEHAALKTTSEALQNYQVQWNTILNTDRQLRMRITKLEQELQQQKTLVNRFGPIDDRNLLERRETDSRSEIERLRGQLVAKASLERELSEQKSRNEEFLKEFTRESQRYRELAEQDHSNQLALWEKLKQAENTIAALNKGAQALL